MQTSLRWKISLVAAATLFAANAAAQPRFTFDATPGQLPKDVVPSAYRLALDLDPASETFTGVADIAVKVRRPVAAIVLNAFELTAGEISLTGAGGARPMTATDDKTKRQWRIADGRGIEPGDIHTRHVNFRSAAIYREQRQLHRLPGNHQSVIGNRVESKAVGSEHRVLVIALLYAEPEVEFVLR